MVKIPDKIKTIIEKYLVLLKDFSLENPLAKEIIETGIRLVYSSKTKSGQIFYLP